MTKNKLSGPNIVNGEVGKSIVRAVYGFTLQRMSYRKIGQMLFLGEDLVRDIAEGKYRPEIRKEFDKLPELRREVTRRKKYFHKYITPYKFKKIESLWLSGKGRDKIIKETGYSQTLVKKVISSLVEKHNKSRADAKSV